MSEEHALFKIAKGLRYELTACQAKVTDLLNELNTLNLPVDASEFVCPKCGADRKGPKALADHLANVHGVSGGSLRVTQ